MPSRAAITNLDDAARKRLLEATDTLAEQLRLPSVEREARISRSPEPTPRTVGDLEAAATLAEAVVFLVEDVEGLNRELDELRQQVTAMKEGAA